MEKDTEGPVMPPERPYTRTVGDAGLQGTVIWPRTTDDMDKVTQANVQRGLSLVLAEHYLIIKNSGSPGFSPESNRRLPLTQLQIWAVNYSLLGSVIYMYGLNIKAASLVSLVTAEHTWQGPGR